MLDMHSHILWGVDDGPKNMEETIKMLEQAKVEGITKIIATSHSNHPQYDVGYDIVTDQLRCLRERIIELDLQISIYSGHEVRIVENIVNLLRMNQIHTLATSDYLLIELPSSSVPNFTTHIIDSLVVEGITPIIAHPERNKAIAEKPERLERLIRHGALAQITAGSLAGHFGKSVQKLSLDLVKANLVHTYGSDVHNLTNRPFFFEKGLSYLEKHKQLDAVDILLENNSRIIENKSFVILEPEEIKKRKWWSFS